MVDGIAEGGAPVMANRVLTVIKKLFGWGVARGLLEADPAAGVLAPGKETARDRVLTDTGSRRSGRRAGAWGIPSARCSGS